MYSVLVPYTYLQFCVLVYGCSFSLSMIVRQCVTLFTTILYKSPNKLILCVWYIRILTISNNSLLIVHHPAISCRSCTDFYMKSYLKVTRGIFFDILCAIFSISIYLSGQAALVMIELLGTYTDKNASHAREDAIRCIVSALADPKTFLLDPLLSLKPVRFLEGELIHDLLNIFVSENLTAYLKFYKEHKEFVTTQGR